MGKVKVSQLFKVIICAVTLYTLGFDKIITLPEVLLSMRFQLQR